MFYWQYFNRFILKGDNAKVSFKIQFWLEFFMWLLVMGLVMVTIYLYCKEVWGVHDNVAVGLILCSVGIIMFVVILTPTGFLNVNHFVSGCQKSFQVFTHCFKLSHIVSTCYDNFCNLWLIWNWDFVPTTYWFFFTENKLCEGLKLVKIIFMGLNWSPVKNMLIKYAKTRNWPPINLVFT